MKSTTPLLKIYMRSTGPDGEELNTETWASWPNFTEQGVLARWKRNNPTLAEHYDRHEVVSPQRRPIIAETTGRNEADGLRVPRWRAGKMRQPKGTAVSA